jgi:two-component system, OmpR family, sensor histidine kinase KdpD
MAHTIIGVTACSAILSCGSSALEKHLRFARSLQMETRVVAGIDIARTVVEFARSHQVTQVFVAPSRGGLRERLLGRNFVENIVRLAEDLQVTVVADRSRRSASS